MVQEFVQYKRQKDGTPIGCIVFLVYPECLRVGEPPSQAMLMGWSLCHKSDRKRFTKRRAREIARARALKSNEEGSRGRLGQPTLNARGLPGSMLDTYFEISHRAFDYADKLLNKALENSPDAVTAERKPFKAYADPRP